MAAQKRKGKESESAGAVAAGASGAQSPEEVATQAMKDAQQAIEAIKAEAGGEDAARPLELPDLESRRSAGGPQSADLSLLSDVNLHVKVELGRTRMYVEDVLRLNTDSVIELDKPAGDPVDIYVNDRHVARGEVLVVNDTFCVRVSEIIQPAAAEE